MARGHSRQRDLAETLLGPRAPRAVPVTRPPARRLTSASLLMWLMQRWPPTRAGYSISAQVARSLIVAADPTRRISESGAAMLLEDLVLEGRLRRDADGGYRVSLRSLADVDDDEPAFYPHPSADTGRCRCDTPDRYWMSTLMVCATCGAALSSEQVESLADSLTL